MSENTATNVTDDLIRQADETFEKYLKEGKYRELIDAMILLGDYSLRNQMLILAAKPDATRVEGMNAWNYRKRSIKPGEKSIKILAPVFAKEVVFDKNGQPTENVVNKVTGYRINYVFDESQTKGEDVRDLKITPEILDKNYDFITDVLKGTIKGFEFGESESLGKEVTSRLDTESRIIEISKTLDKEAKLKTLINQIAAANVLTRDRRNFIGIRSSEMNGVEMSAITYIVANRLGLKTDKLTEPDFSKFGEKDFARFAGNIGVIRSVSQKIIMAVENKLSYELHKQKTAAAEPKVTEVKPVKTENIKSPASKGKKKTEVTM